jgi:hypothetical protein
MGTPVILIRVEILMPFSSRSWFGQLVNRTLHFCPLRGHVILSIDTFRVIELVLNQGLTTLSEGIDCLDFIFCLALLHIMGDIIIQVRGFIFSLKGTGLNHPFLIFILLRTVINTAWQSCLAVKSAVINLRAPHFFCFSWVIAQVLILILGTTLKLALRT